MPNAFVEAKEYPKYLKGKKKNKQVGGVEMFIGRVQQSYILYDKDML